MPHPRLLAATLILAATAHAQQPSASIEQQLPTLIDTYKTLHQHPELSHHEEWTAAYLATALRKLGFTVTEHIGKYPDGTSADGIIAVLINGPGLHLLLRTELDALPVTEKTNLPYASTVTTKNDAGQQVGVMHACGHDLHITTILGTAQQLVAQNPIGTAPS